MLRRWAAVLGTAAITLAGLSGTALATGSPDDSVPAPSVTAEATPGQQLPVEPAPESVQEAPDASIEAAEPAEPQAVSLAALPDPVVAGNLTLQANRVNTGTGHGTETQCAISTRGGATVGPYDDSPDDDYVCTRDTVSYKLSFQVAQSPNPVSARIVVAPETMTAALTTSTFTTFCSSDPEGSFTAVDNAGPANGLDCTFTFPANTSAAGDWELVYETRRGTADLWTPTWTVDVGDGAVAVPASGFQVLQTYTYDVRHRGYIPAAPTYRLIDGQPYVQAIYQVGARALRMPGGFGADKGRSFDWSRAGHDNTGTIEFYDLPAGSIIEPGGGGALNPDGTVSYSVSNTLSNTTTFQPWFRTNVWVPLSELEQPRVWESQVVDTTAEPRTTSASWGHYTHNLPWAGIMTDPGLDQPLGYSTTNTNGTGSQGGGDAPNNNWSRVAFQATQAGDIFGKQLYLEDRTTFDARYRNFLPDAKYWTRLDLDADPVRGQASQIVMCDAFSNQSESASIGMSMYDTSRDPEVTVWQMDNSGVSTAITPTYQILFRDSGLGDSPKIDKCGEPGDTEGWSADPTDADAVKVVIEGPISMLGNGALSADVWLPFKLGPKEAYPEWPALTISRDAATYALSSDAGFSSLSKDAYLRLMGASASASSELHFLMPGGLMGGAKPTEYAAGNDLTLGFRTTPGVTGAVEPDQPLTGTASGSIQLDSCLGDLRNIRLLDASGRIPNPSGLTNFEYTVIGDTGACTPGEPGPRIEYSFDYDRRLLDTGAGHTTMINLTLYADATVSLNARAQSQLAAYGELTFTYDDAQLGSVTTTENDLFTVHTPQIVGQQKYNTHVYEPVGTRVGWELMVYNNTQQVVNNAEFIDVLPYNGDGRETDLANPLQGIELDTSQVTGATVYVTDADPATLPRESRDPQVDPGNTALWCQYGTAGCVEDRAITAIYLVFAQMAPGFTATLGVTTDTSNQSDGDWLNNDMGEGASTSLALSIPASQLVRTQLWLGTITGTIYEDMGRDGDQQVEIDPGAPTVWVHLLNADLTPVLGGNGEPIRVQVGADGYYEFTDLRPGGYQTMIVTEGTEYAEHDITQAWQVIITDDPAPTRYSKVITIDATTPKVHEVDFGLNTGQPISVVKLDAVGQPRTGAEFVLTSPEGAVELIVDTEQPHLFSSERLRFDTQYTLTETKAPEGLSLLAEPVVFTVSPEGIALVSGGSSLVRVGADGFTIEVGDVPGAQMPHTGGLGASAPWLGAGLLVVLGSGWLVRRRLIAD